jgi:hypothetical protein
MAETMGQPCNSHRNIFQAASSLQCWAGNGKPSSGWPCAALDFCLSNDSNVRNRFPNIFPVFQDFSRAVKWMRCGWDVMDMSLVAWRVDGGCHGMPMPMRPGLGAKHFVCGGIGKARDGGRRWILIVHELILIIIDYIYIYKLYTHLIYNNIYIYIIIYIYNICMYSIIRHS